MNRRDFLAKGFLGTGLALGGAVGMYPRVSRASQGRKGNFTVEIVTDRPDEAIRRVERILRESEPGASVVNFSENCLPGRHVGDIAFVRDGKLVDFRREGDEVSRQLRGAASALSLPRDLSDPSWLQFAAGLPASVPKEIQVRLGDELLRRIPMDGTRDVYRIEGARGRIELAVGNRGARILSSTCAHQTCVNMGTITRPGQHLVCIPNRITVALSGASVTDLDGITF